MKNTHFAVFLLALSMSACVQKNEKNEEKPVTDSVTVNTDVRTNSTTPDWVGEYKGVIPCEDCDGIETSITLNKDSTYILKTTYQGKGNTSEDKGTFTWLEPSSRVVLKSNDIEQVYLIGNGTLTILNSEGKITEGELADDYVLKKQ